MDAHWQLHRTAIPALRQETQECIIDGDIEQSLAADGAIACFSSNFFPSAGMLIARRS